jgi:hypothetical protein
MVTLAAKTGFSRHRIARWLSGAAEPKLPQWLALIDASSMRLLDLVAAFVDSLTLPSVSRVWRRLQAARDFGLRTAAKSRGPAGSGTRRLRETPAP